MNTNGRFAVLVASHLVDGVLQRIEHIFVGHLGHRGVSVNRVGDVLEDGAQLEGEGPLTDQFADVGADALNAEDAGVVFAGHHADEAARLVNLIEVA